jgi:hypothetical protein
MSTIRDPRIVPFDKFRDFYTTVHGQYFFPNFTLRRLRDSLHLGQNCTHASEPQMVLL